MTKQIQLTQGKFATVDDEDFEWLNQWNWRAMKRGNRILMHRVIMNAPKDTQVDHRNGDGLFNLRENLRVCTNAENGRNRRRINKNNSSGFKGVCWSARDKRWIAKIKHDYRGIHLGNFSTAEEAARAYDTAAKELYGDFAVTNF